MAERLVGSNSQVIDIPINSETKSRQNELGRLGITLLEVELYKVVRVT